jgi:hypothetical protein
VRPAWPHPEWVLQKTFWNEFLWFFEVLLGVVNLPDVNEDGSALGNAIAIINVVLGWGVRNRLRRNGTPAVDLLGNFSVLLIPSGL